MNLHIKEKRSLTQNGPRVCVLTNTENENPRDIATLLSLYSRDPQPIDSAVKLFKDGTQFYEKYYIGYSHESVGENAVMFLALENIPIPIAKAIQHYFRYSGTEVSTRFLNCGKQPCWTYGLGEADKLRQQTLQGFYNSAWDQVYKAEYAWLSNAWLSGANTSTLSDTDLQAKIASNAKTRTFDILRGFIPTGMLTSLSWVASISDLNKQVGWLYSQVDVLPGLAEVLELISSLMKEHIGSAYKPKLSEKRAYATESVPSTPFTWVGRHILSTSEETFLEYVSTEMDYGSWRDWARHRSVSIGFVLPANAPVNEWYIRSLPRDLQSEAVEVLKRASGEHVYVQPLATTVTTHALGFASHFSYITKLRTGPTVHPTLRRAMHELAAKAKKVGVSLELTSATLQPDLRRGEQVITRLT